MFWPDCTTWRQIRHLIRVDYKRGHVLSIRREGYLIPELIWSRHPQHLAVAIELGKLAEVGVPGNPRQSAIPRE
jgi:hypothetical protein